MLFEWDPDKNRQNRSKHGIDFELARHVFDDPFSTTAQDRDVEGEQRYQTIGAIADRVILVAHTLRPSGRGMGDPGSIVRIISARKATPAERKQYDGDIIH